MEKELEQEEQKDDNYYIEAINKVKQNSVPKEEYEAIKESNKKLIDALTNGNYQTDKEPEKPKVDINEIVDGFKNNKYKTTMEASEKALQLREAIIDEYDMDIFVPAGGAQALDSSSYEKADKVANYLSKCLESANGNVSSFQKEFCDGMIDNSPKQKR